MPKVSIYLSDELYAQARSCGLPLSSLAQGAVERALADSRREEWVARVRARPSRHRGRLDTAGALDEARAEFGR